MFIIPMVGKSSRFFNEGYSVPKYKLIVGEHSVFEHSVQSFKRYFLTDKFLFLVRADYDAASFVREKAQNMGIIDYSIVVFTEETEGQADTVGKGLLAAQDFYSRHEPVYIFNIDTFRPDFRKSDKVCDGYLEVFRGEGQHWSFVLPGSNNTVLKTTEKERISDLCSDGLYFFATASLFLEAFGHGQSLNLKAKGEYYIAPLYNILISRGLKVIYETIRANEVVFCGTPTEYELIKNNYANSASIM